MSDPQPQPQGAELAPCPFCGSTDVRFIGGFHISDGVAVQCMGCDCAMGANWDRDAMPDHAYRSEEDAAEAWNRRSPGPQAASAPPPVGALEGEPSEAVDAARYRAIKARHAYSIVKRFIDQSGYSSHKAGAQIDAWADAAADEIAAWEAKSPEEKTAWFAEYSAAALAALSGSEGAGS